MSQPPSAGRAPAPGAPGGDQHRSTGLYRRAVAHVTVGIDFPFGYTVTVWSAGALATHDFGSPRPVDVAVFLGGAVVTYLLLAGLAYVEQDAHTSLRSARGVTLMNAVPVAPVALVSLIGRVVETPLVGWLLSGSVATGAYVMSLAGLVAWSASRARRADAQPRARRTGARLR